MGEQEFDISTCLLCARGCAWSTLSMGKSPRCVGKGVDCVWGKDSQRVCSPSSLLILSLAASALISCVYKNSIFDKLCVPQESKSHILFTASTSCALGCSVRPSSEPHELGCLVLPTHQRPVPGAWWTPLSTSTVSALQRNHWSPAALVELPPSSESCTLPGCMLGSTGPLGLPARWALLTEHNMPSVGWCDWKLNGGWKRVTGKEECWDSSATSEVSHLFLGLEMGVRDCEPASQLPASRGVSLVLSALGECWGHGQWL